MAKVSCPECDSVLNPAKPLTPGKKVRCPRCEAVFTVPFPEFDDAEAAEEEKPARKKKEPAQKAATAGKKAAPAKTEPPPAAPKPAGDDDEGGTYGFHPSELKEEDDAPKINYAPDVSVKDPRGPAIKRLAMPSNWVIIHGAELFFGGMLAFALGIWPFVFMDYIVDPKIVVREFEMKKKAAQRRAMGENAPKEDEELQIPEVKPEDLSDTALHRDWVDAKLSEKYDEMVEEASQEYIWMMVCGVLALLYGGVVCYAGVQMQTLESYRWSIAGGILVILGGLIVGGAGVYFLAATESNAKIITPALTGLAFGAWALVVLKEPKVKDAFSFKPE